MVKWKTAPGTKVGNTQDAHGGSSYQLSSDLHTHTVAQHGPNKQMYVMSNNRN